MGQDRGEQASTKTLRDEQTGDFVLAEVRYGYLKEKFDLMSRLQQGDEKQGKVIERD
jgi:hypothetical protein